MKDKRFPLRLIYITGWLLLFVVEVLIALFVDDRFIRPYGGDILVVILLGCLYRSFRPRGSLWLTGGIFAFAVAVEIAQYFHFVDRIGLGHIAFFRTIIGTSFAWKDIWSYGAGCLVFLLADWLLQRHGRLAP